MSAPRGGGPRPSPDASASDGGGGKRARRTSAAELRLRLLRSLDSNLASLRALTAPPPRPSPNASTPAQLSTPAPLGAASPPLIPRAPPLRALPPREFYSGGGAARASRGPDVVEEWLRSLSQRVVQRCAALREPFQDAFATQAEAFAWADARTAELDAELPSGAPRLTHFSREDAATGRRYFGAAPAAALWRRYRALPATARHHYELLREGRRCRLYFDLEFDAAENPGRDGPAAVDALLSLLRDALHKRLSLSLADCALVELDSSSASKFSRHLVLHAPGGAAFASAVAVGAFVRAFWAEDVVSRRGADVRADACFVRRAGQEELVPFVDLGVYTRNRAFRFYLSSKAGKEARLLPTARCWNALRGSPLAGRELPADAPEMRSDADAALSKPARWLFFAALISDVPADAPMLGDPAPAPTLASVPSSRRGAHGGGSVAGGAGSEGVAAGGGSTCPCPATAAAVCAAAASCGGGTAGVRSWAAFPAAGCLVLNLSRNRYCGRLGRPHKSNGVFYVVDFRANAAFQKCHDPECRAAGFRGEPLPLPPAAAAEATALDALLPPAMPQQQQQQQQQALRSWVAEDAWLETLSAAELAALDAGPAAAAAAKGDAADADGDDDAGDFDHDGGWWLALPPAEWAALDAACAAQTS